MAESFSLEKLRHAPQKEVCVCVCVFSSHSFWTSMDVPAGVTQEEGHTGFLIHLLSAVHALIIKLNRRQARVNRVAVRLVQVCKGSDVGPGQLAL